MPTASRLVAALCLAALGWFVSELVKALIEEDTNFGHFTLVNTCLGVLVGWIVVGSRAGRGYSSAVGNGITGVAALVFWALFVQAVNEMVRLSLRRRFDGVMEAINATFELFVEFAAYLADPSVLTALISGALITGILSEYADRRWS